MIGASTIGERIRSGLCVTVERGDRRWTLPVETTLHERRCSVWMLFDELRAADQITFPDAVSDQTLLSAATWMPWNLESLCIQAVVSCPACSTRAAHPVEIPDRLWSDWWWPVWVARTCITCDHSWMQETE